MKFYYWLFCQLVAVAAFANSGQPINLVDAVNKKTIEIKAVASGGRSADNIACTIKNLSKNRVEVEIPAGLHFVPSEPEKQDLITVKEMLIAMEPGSVNKFYLQGFCMKANNLAPSGNQNYSFNGYAPENLKQLARLLSKTGNFADSYAQMYVWAITDNRSVYSVSVPENLMAQAKEISQYVSTVSNKPAAEITASSSLKFTPTIEVFSKSTFLAFHIATDQIANFKMYDEHGNEKHTFYTNRKLKHGVLKYEVGVNEIIPYGTSPSFSLKVVSNTGRVLAEKTIDNSTQHTDIEPELLNFVFDCTTAQAAKNASLKIYLQDGTLVEEIAKYKYLPVGNFKIRTKLLHLYPAKTTFVARLEGPNNKVLYTQEIK